DSNTVRETRKGSRLKSPYKQNYHLSVSLSYGGSLRVAMMIGATPSVFQISAGSLMVDRCQWSFQAKTDKEERPDDLLPKISQ
ncbi:hypothetical protein NG726_31500, partial [Pseudomonas sp. MOB-449]|nr:hypothetical protein [Pseudomonas sp. MOB-449]